MASCILSPSPSLARFTGWQGASLIGSCCYCLSASACIPYIFYGCSTTAGLWPSSKPLWLRTRPVTMISEHCFSGRFLATSLNATISNNQLQRRTVSKNVHSALCSCSTGLSFHAQRPPCYFPPCNYARCVERAPCVAVSRRRLLGIPAISIRSLQSIPVQMDCELENGRRRNIPEPAVGNCLAIGPHFFPGCLWTFRVVQEGRRRLDGTETRPDETRSSAQFRTCHGRLWVQTFSLRKNLYTVSDVATIFFTSNLIGIIFARSLHYQFYSWYAQQLPFLAWRTRYPVLVK